MSDRAEAFAAALARDLERCAMLHAVMTRELGVGFRLGHPFAKPIGCGVKRFDLINIIDATRSLKRRHAENGGFGQCLCHGISTGCGARFAYPDAYPGSGSPSHIRYVDPAETRFIGEQDPQATASPGGRTLRFPHSMWKAIFLKAS